MSVATPSIVSPGEDEVEYPASDGQPMAETGIHVEAILQLFALFQDHLPATDFIAADMFWYWEQGHPESRVAPDLMVVKGVSRAHRRSFFTWREGGTVPCIVFEMASEHTWREDLWEKRPRYERLGVREYVLFDPEGEYLRPRLQGFRLVEGRYEPIEPDRDGRLRSEELGVFLRPEGLVLRLFDATTGAPVPTRQEQIEQERRNAEQERRNAEQERYNAEQERRRADFLAAEVERLKALLERGGGVVGGGAAE
jgi:Uma2 family endonuclease